MLRGELVNISLLPTLEVEVASVCRLALVTSLDKDEERSANNWDKVKRQVHKVPHQRLDRKLLERLLCNLAQSIHRVTIALQLAALGDQGCAVASYECAIEGIDDCVSDNEVAGQDVGDCGGFGEDEEDGCEWCEWAVGEEHYTHLWNVGEGEHEDYDADGQAEGREDFGGEGLP